MFHQAIKDWDCNINKKLTLKMMGGVGGLLKTMFSRERERESKALLSETFNIIIKQIFPKNLIEI